MSAGSPQSMPLRISVNISKGHIKVWPDPAEVVEGMPVEWQIKAQTNLPNLIFEVYFSNATPTGWSAEKLIVERSGLGASSSSIAAIARDPGEYKYGVKATALESGEVIADDDPILIVRPRNG